MGTVARILVIRLGALGDLILCQQAFHEIRLAHKDAEIALLTTPAFESFAKSMPWFDSVIATERAPMWQIHKWANLVARLYQFAPKRVYDLQGKFRQSVLFLLLGGPLWGPEWSGAAEGCSHPRLWPPEPGMHFVNFVAAQLRRAGVPEAPAADLAWLDAPLDSFALPQRFALLIPGCSPKLMHKRWPPECYAELAKRLQERGIASVAIGTKAEADTIAALRRDAPDVIDLCGRTSLPQIAALARRAACVVGNDTGPGHIAGAVGAPTLALFGPTDPIWSSPRGPRTAWIKRDPLTGLGVDEVLLALMALLGTEERKKRLEVRD